jgi:two-component system OmpR family response regulator
MRILVVEDDAEVRKYIVKGLSELGHNVDAAPDGREGLFLAQTESYDILILDRLLPHLDGLKLLQTLRSTENQVPVLILSALGEVDDRVEGLRAGGDDYLVKPFAFAELQARIEVLARRSAATSQVETILKMGDLELNILSRKVTRAGQTIELQAREFKLLEYLMRHPSQVITRTMLLENVWDYHFDPQTNVIDVHISRLRGKVDKGFTPPLIHTIRGAGYQIHA